jgi:TolB-like protein/DNA-binding SARP family transcriptional activator
LHVYEFGDFRLDAARRVLSGRDGSPEPLKAKAFDALLYLVVRAGEVVEKQELMGALWPGEIKEENNLNQLVTALRRTLGDTRAVPRYIETVTGYGYRFVARVTTQGAPAAGRAAPSVRAVAVLPFKPLVAEHRDVALEMGMADTLIARLSSIKELCVRPISSVRKYAELEQDPLAAGRELEVESVLEGSLQRWGDKIRVSARLVQVASGVSMWAGTFDEKFTDIFALQDAISERVVGALALELNSEEKRRLTKHHTENTDAYQLYLKGRYYWWKTAPAEFSKCRDYFHRAVEADPTYALSYCGIASYYGFGAAWGMYPPDKGWPIVLAANVKALELDDQLAEAHNNHAATSLVCHHDWATAEREALRAIELNPKFDEVHYFYSFYLLVAGRFDEAVVECRRALEIDPFSLRINKHLGDCFYHARSYDEAIGQYRQTLELDPNNALAREALGDAYERAGMPGEAVAEWKGAMTLAGDEELADTLSIAYATGGFDAAVLAVAGERLRRLNERAAGGAYVPAIHFARAFAKLGEWESVLHHLAAACEERNVFALLIKGDPLYDAIRSDPRFKDLLESVGVRA